MYTASRFWPSCYLPLCPGACAWVQSQTGMLEPRAPALGNLLPLLTCSRQIFYCCCAGPVATSMTEGMGDQEKMIQPQDVAEAALLPLRTTGGATPKEVGLRIRKQCLQAARACCTSASCCSAALRVTCGMPCRSPLMSQSPSSD